MNNIYLYIIERERERERESMVGSQRKLKIFGTNSEVNHGMPWLRIHIGERRCYQKENMKSWGNSSDNLPLLIQYIKFIYIYVFSFSSTYHKYFYTKLIKKKTVENSGFPISNIASLALC